MYKKLPYEKYLACCKIPGHDIAMYVSLAVCEREGCAKKLKKIREAILHKNRYLSKLQSRKKRHLVILQYTYEFILFYLCVNIKFRTLFKENSILQFLDHAGIISG